MRSGDLGADGSSDTYRDGQCSTSLPPQERKRETAGHMSVCHWCGGMHDMNDIIVWGRGDRNLLKLRTGILTINDSDAHICLAQMSGATDYILAKSIWSEPRTLCFGKLETNKQCYVDSSHVSSLRGLCGKRTSSSNSAPIPSNLTNGDGRLEVQGNGIFVANLLFLSFFNFDFCHTSAFPGRLTYSLFSALLFPSKAATTLQSNISITALQPLGDVPVFSRLGHFSLYCRLVNTLPPDAPPRFL